MNERLTTEFTVEESEKNALLVDLFEEYYITDNKSIFTNIFFLDFLLLWWWWCCCAATRFDLYTKKL